MSGAASCYDVNWMPHSLFSTSGPQSTGSGSPMPSFAGLGEDNLHKLAVFLEASKGEVKH